MRHDIFISYSRKDNAIVYSYIDLLEQLEYTIWVDRTGIETGDKFMQKIYQAIDNAGIFLFFSSKSSNESEWVAKEIQHALSIDIPIIPVRLDESAYHQKVKKALDDMDFASLSGLNSNDDESIKRVLNAISNKLWDAYSIQPSEVVIKKADALIPVNKELGFKLMKIAAQRGEPLAQYRVGDFYAYGIGCKKDLSQAIRWYNLSSEQHFCLAQVELGRFLIQGIGAQKDEQRAFLLFNEAASQNYDKAYLELGKCYEKGTGTDYNLKKAIECFHTVAISNSPMFKKEAQYLCADAIRKDAEINERVMGSLPAYCLKLYYLAAQQGHDEAQYSLGLLIEKGMEVEFTQAEINERFEFYDWLISSGSPAKASYPNMTTFVYLVKPNQIVANSWYKKSASNGNKEAQMKLGDFYYYIEPDLKLALSYYREAASQKSSRAYFLLGEYCRLGIGGELTNKNKAAEYYQNASELGNAQASAILALWNYKEENDKKDKRHENSRKYAEKGIEANNRLAQYVMGLIYSDGLLPNKVRAKHYFELSAFQDFAPAQYELACCIQREQYDSPEAIKWFEKAANLGNIQAMRRLKYILKKTDPLKSLQYLEKAVSAGDVKSAYELSLLLFQGEGTPADAKRAIALLRESAKTYMPALKALAERYAKGDGVDYDIVQSNSLFNEYFDWMMKNNPTLDYSLEMLILGINFYLGRNGYQHDISAAEYWFDRGFASCPDWQDRIVCLGFAYEDGGIFPYNPQKRDYWFNRALTINRDFSSDIAEVYETGEVILDDDDQFFIKCDKEKAFYYRQIYIGGDYARALEQCLRKNCADTAFWLTYASTILVPRRPSNEKVIKCVSLTEELVVSISKRKDLQLLPEIEKDIELIISNTDVLFHRRGAESLSMDSVGVCSLMLAHSYHTINYIEQAKNYYMFAIETLEQCSSDNYKHYTNLAFGYTNLANIMKHEGLYKKAVNCLRKAAIIFEHLSQTVDKEYLKQFAHANYDIYLICIDGQLDQGEAETAYYEAKKAFINNNPKSQFSEDDMIRWFSSLSLSLSSS